MKKRGLIISCLVFSILLVNLVFAADVAFVLKKDRQASQGFIDVFRDMGLSFEFIENKDIEITDFSLFKYIFIQDNRLSNMDMVPKDKPTILANHYHLKDFGFIKKGLCSQTVSSSGSKLKSNGEVIEMYNRPSFKFRGLGVPMYYIPNRYKEQGSNAIATTFTRSNNELGDTIVHSSEAGIKKCFFGVVQSEYWTDEAKGLFENCVKYVIQGLHDVKIDETLTSSVNGIRIKDNDAGAYITDSVAELECDKSYKIDYRTLNVGDYPEDISFTGELGNIFSWSATKTGLDSGSSTTTGSKTLTVDRQTFPEGNYILQITADNGYDDNPMDNIKTRDVRVVC